MTKELIECSRRRHEFADRALVVTTIALVVSLVIAFTAVSIGIARADTLVPAAEGGGRLAPALLLGLVVAAIGGLTAAVVRDGHSSPRRP
jgi:hypothetical protein